MRRIFLCVLCLLAAGCAASLPTDDRSPEQIAASVKDKSITATCIKATTMVATSTIAHLSVDATVIRSGAVSVDAATCSIGLTNEASSR